MKEKPILFSGPMVRAILDGTKTQTRRVIPDKIAACLDEPRDYETKNSEILVAAKMSPYGVPGDRQWVRETWSQTDWRWNGIDGKRTWYKATDENDPDIMAWWAPECGDKWHPSIHMPRALSRITLEITGIRVERVRDISEDDARAEGAEPWSSDGLEFNSYYNSFAHLWDCINGTKPGRSWGDNPYVWCIEFRRLP